jgi:thioredoxin-related protein
MKKLISILLVIFLFSCKTSKSGCDAYSKVSVKKTTNTTK